MEENKYVEEQYEEIDLMELFRKLLKNWKLILKWCGVAAVIGLVVGFSIPKEYTVSSRMAPEVVNRSSGNLSSLASLAGINLNNVSTSDAVYPDLYPDIVSSNPFVVELFSMPVSFEHKGETVDTDLYDYLKNYTRSPWWSYVVQAPFKALGWFMGLFREKTEPVEGYADLDPSALTKEQEDIAKALRNSINISVDSKTSVISADVTAQDPVVATRLSEALIEQLQEYVTAYRTEKSRKDLEYYQQLYDEAREVYYDAQQKYAQYVDANQGVVRQSVMIEQDRLRSEMELNNSLYTTCAQQLQMAKAKVQMETPVYAVITPPTMPLEPSKPSKMMTLIAFIFLGGVLSCVWVLWGRDWIKSFRSGLKEDDAPAPAKPAKKAAHEEVQR